MKNITDHIISALMGLVLAMMIIAALNLML